MTKDSPGHSAQLEKILETQTIDLHNALDESHQISEKLTLYTTILDENPNPVIQIDEAGKITYNNLSGKMLLKQLVVQDGFLSEKNFTASYNDILHSQREYKTDIECQDATFSLIFVPLPKARCINIYGIDITAFAHVRESLEKDDFEIEELKHQLTSLNSIPEQNPNPVIKIDHTGMVLYINNSGRDMIENIKIDNNILCQDVFGVDYDKILCGGQPQRHEFKSGEVSYLLVFTPAAGDNEINIYGMDISAQKNIALGLEFHNLRLQQSNSELEQFAYVASHDLQEPLRMVASYTQLLAKRYSGRLDEKAQKYIDYAVDGAKRMQTLINDLLDYSRIGTRGKKFTEVDCQDVVDRALEIMRENVTQCEAVISVGEMPEVIGDENQLVQVFQNLIGNALKYRSGRKPLVTISAKKKDLYWEFRVEDNGIGIASQYHERIFTIFQRLHGRTEYSGSGIGLSIVKKIIERHNGRIRVESEEGKGAAFIFTLLGIRKR